MACENSFTRSVSLGVVGLTAILSCAHMSLSEAAVLDNEDRRIVTLSDGLQVTLIGAVKEGNEPSAYYALPNQLMNSTDSSGEPQFLFMSFTTNDRPEDGGSSGALLHTLMEWGLTPEQSIELDEKVARLGNGAHYEGFVQMLPPDGQQANFAVVSALLGDEGTENKVLYSDTAPLVAGGKVAIAARLDPITGQAMYKTFEGDSSVADLSVSMNLAYTTQVQGPNGTITFDWSSVEARGESLEAEYRETYGWAKDRDSCWLFWRCDAETVEYSYDEAYSQYEFMNEEKLVTFEFNEGFPSEAAAELRQAFLQYYMNLMSEPVPPPVRPVSEDEEEDPQAPDIRQGSHYSFSKSRVEEVMKRRKEVISMDYRFQVRWPHQITGNLKEWKNNAASSPNAYQKVILDDPFFTWRDVVVSLDLDSKGLFEEQANFVTVDIEKRREQGVWRESVTFDQSSIAEKGNSAHLTYARGDDPNSDTYRYKYQWSLRGGEHFPEEPQWQDGTWEGISLNVPLKALTMELEANIEDLKASDITRVTAQVRYNRLGREWQENLAVSAAAGEPLKTALIFTDSESRGYAYRLIFNHKFFGRLATEWSARLNDNYIYALIPEELRVIGSSDEPAVVQAQDAAAAEAQDVISNFSELLAEGQ